MRWHIEKAIIDPALCSWTNHACKHFARHDGTIGEVNGREKKAGEKGAFMANDQMTHLND